MPSSTDQPFTATFEQLTDRGYLTVYDFGGAFVVPASGTVAERVTQLVPDGWARQHLGRISTDGRGELDTWVVFDPARVEVWEAADGPDIPAAAWQLDVGGLWYLHTAPADPEPRP